MKSNAFGLKSPGPGDQVPTYRTYGVQKLVFLMLFLTLLPSFVFAANRYIRAGATGANNGSSWADAWTSFSRVTWTRGDTYYVAGGSYAENVTATAALSGSTWIRIKKANTPDNSGDAGWDVSYATTQAKIGKLNIASAYIEVDGVTGSGTNGHGILVSNQVDTVIQVNANVGNIHLYHLEVVGIAYMVSSNAYDGIYINNYPSQQKGYHIAYCWIHNVNRNGICLGNVVGTSYSDYGVLIENNVLSETGGCIDPNKHGQGIQVCYDAEDNYTIYRNNIFHNILGSGIMAYLGGANAIHRNALIYNNVFSCSPGDTRWYNSPGVICGFSAVTVSNINILNNTFYNLSRVIGGCSQVAFIGGIITNNTIKNCVWENSNFTQPSFGVIQSNNGYYNNIGSPPTGTPGQINGSTTTFVSPAAGDFRLRNGGYGVGAGLNLNDYFTTDFSGATRGSAWDIGAYQYKTVTSLAPPADLRVISIGR